MKAQFIFIILFSFYSCSQKKSGTQSNFKIVIGAAALEVPMNGGAYLETFEKASGVKSLTKLDAENSAVIPYGSYQLLFVTFAGPLEKSGTMYCGAIDSAVLNSETATFEVSLAQSSCSEEKFIEIIKKLIGDSNWDSATFDNSKWAP